MARLLFYDDTHRYTVDGEEVPSVSELIRFITRELYTDTPQYFMEGAAARGTLVHKATESLDEFGKVECEDDIAPYIQAYVSFLKDCQPNWEKIEWPICNGTRYAGTVDRYGELNGKKVVLDIKTTQSISGMHKLLYGAQLTLYKMAVEQERPVEKLVVLQLKKDGSYKLIPIEENEPLALACLTMHEAIKNSKTKRRKKA